MPGDIEFKFHWKPEEDSKPETRVRAFLKEFADSKDKEAFAQQYGFLPSSENEEESEQLFAFATDVADPTVKPSQKNPLLVFIPWLKAELFLLRRGVPKQNQSSTFQTTYEQSDNFLNEIFTACFPIFKDRKSWEVETICKNVEKRTAMFAMAERVLGSLTPVIQRCQNEFSNIQITSQKECELASAMYCSMAVLSSHAKATLEKYSAILSGQGMTGWIAASSLGRWGIKKWFQIEGDVDALMASLKESVGKAHGFLKSVEKLQEGLKASIHQFEAPKTVSLSVVTATPHGSLTSTPRFSGQAVGVEVKEEASNAPFTFYWDDKEYPGKPGEDACLLPLRHFHDYCLSGSPFSDACPNASPSSQERPKRHKRYPSKAFSSPTHIEFAQTHYFRDTLWHEEYDRGDGKGSRVFHQIYVDEFETTQEKYPEQDTCVWIFPQWLVSELYQHKRTLDHESPAGKFRQTLVVFAKDISEAMKKTWKKTSKWQPWLLKEKYETLFQEIHQAFKKVEDPLLALAKQPWDHDICYFAECFCLSLDVLNAALPTVPVNDIFKGAIQGAAEQLKNSSVNPLQTELRSKIQAFRSPSPLPQENKQEHVLETDKVKVLESYRTYFDTFLKKIKEWNTIIQEEYRAYVGVIDIPQCNQDESDQALLQEFYTGFEAKVENKMDAFWTFCENQKLMEQEEIQKKRSQCQQALATIRKAESKDEFLKQYCAYWQEEVKKAKKICDRALKKFKEDAEKALPKDNPAPSFFQQVVIEIRAFMKGLSMMVGEMMATLFSMIPVSLGGTWGVKGFGPASSYTPLPGGGRSGVVGGSAKIVPAAVPMVEITTPPSVSSLQSCPNL